MTPRANQRSLPMTLRPRVRRARRWALVCLGAGVLLGAAGCAGKRIVDGVFHSPKGYRVTLPVGPWEVVERTRTDLDLHHAAKPLGMTVHATCEGPQARTPLDVLVRHLLIGLRDRSIISTDEVFVDGRIARHAIVEGRLGETGELVRLEYYVVRDARCVYDFLYAAPPPSFEHWRPVFQRLVQSFRTE